MTIEILERDDNKTNVTEKFTEVLYPSIEDLSNRAKEIFSTIDHKNRTVIRFNFQWDSCYIEISKTDNDPETLRIIGGNYR